MWVGVLGAVEKKIRNQSRLKRRRFVRVKKSDTRFGKVKKREERLVRVQKTVESCVIVKKIEESFVRVKKMIRDSSELSKVWLIF